VNVSLNGSLIEEMKSANGLYNYWALIIGVDKYLSEYDANRYEVVSIPNHQGVRIEDGSLKNNGFTVRTNNNNPANTPPGSRDQLISDEYEVHFYKGTKLVAIVYFAVSDNSLSIPFRLSENDTISVVVITLAQNASWTASSDVNWLQLTPSKGIGNGSIRITATENTSNFDRTGTITIQSNGISRTITVTQAKALLIQPNKIGLFQAILRVFFK